MTSMYKTSSTAPRLVVKVGRARSGKDTCANYLRDVWGYKVEHFAGALKKGSKEFFGYNDDQLNGESKMTEDPYWGITPRLSFQLIGTELMRKQFPKLVMDELRKLNPDKEIPDRIGDNFWIKRIEMDYLRLQPNEQMCIADGRFPNETAFAKERGGISIRITRPGTAKMDHDSERFIDELDVDYDIVNDGTIGEMLDKIRKILNLDDVDKSTYTSLYTHDEYIECLANGTLITSQQLICQKSDNIEHAEPSMQVIVLLGNQKNAITTMAWTLHDKLGYTIIKGNTASRDLHQAYESNPHGKYITILGDTPYHESRVTPATLIEVRFPMARAKYLAHEYIYNENPISSAACLLDMVTDSESLNEYVNKN